MLTPQDITEKAFETAMFGGYQTTPVDDFLETVASDFSKMQKENAELKKKLKILIDKVEEYRATDDEMRTTLLTAKRQAAEIVTDAERRRDEMAARAEREYEDKTGQIRDMVADEEERLIAARAETVRFLQASRGLLDGYSDFLTRLDEIHRQPAPPTPPPTREEKIRATAREIDANVERQTAEVKVEKPKPPDTREDAGYDDEGAPTRRYAGRQFDDEGEPTSPRPKFDFDNLKFGKNAKDDKD